MTRRRWIADEVSGDRAALVGDHADHLVRVLRARIGQDFDIATGEATRRGRITSLSPDRVEFELGEELPAEQIIEITVVLGIFKFDRMEWAIEKCTELGVARILPLIARRTDSHLAAASPKRIERWRRIVRQAAEQSRRSAPPEIVAPIKLSEALNFPAALRIVLAESEEQTLLRDVLKCAASRLQDLQDKDMQDNDLQDNDLQDKDLKGKDLKDKAQGVVLALGPEGGWTDEELQSFRQASWISASLGSSILRAETAAIAATAVVASALNSF
jgi:16S rRNA (uracil1498-N3)-methyltransferase